MDLNLPPSPSEVTTTQQFIFQGSTTCLFLYTTTISSIIYQLLLHLTYKCQKFGTLSIFLFSQTSRSVSLHSDNFTLISIHVPLPPLGPWPQAHSTLGRESTRSRYNNIISRDLSSVPITPATSPASPSHPPLVILFFICEEQSRTA